MESRFNRVTVSFLVVGLVLGFLLGYLSFKDDEKTEVNKKVENNLPVSGLLDNLNKDSVPNVKEYLITANDQNAGNVAVVSKVSLAQRSWVAIADDANGDIGFVLGAIRLPAGVYENVAVDLLRATDPNNTYHVVIYKNDSDFDYFDYKVNTIVTNADGSILMSDFKTFN